MKRIFTFCFLVVACLLSVLPSTKAIDYAFQFERPTSVFVEGEEKEYSICSFKDGSRLLGSTGHTHRTQDSQNTVPSYGSKAPMFFIVMPTRSITTIQQFSTVFSFFATSMHGNNAWLKSIPCPILVRNLLFCTWRK